MDSRICGFGLMMLPGVERQRREGVAPPLPCLALLVFNTEGLPGYPVGGVIRTRSVGREVQN